MRAAAEACQGGAPVISSSSLNRHNMKASSLWLVGFCHCGNHRHHPHPHIMQTSDQNDTQATEPFQIPRPPSF